MEIAVLSIVCVGGYVVLRVFWNMAVEALISSGQADGFEGEDGTGYIVYPYEEE